MAGHSHGSPDLVVADEPASADAFLLLYTLPTYLWIQPHVRVSLACADGTRAAREYPRAWTQEGSPDDALAPTGFP